MAAERRDAHHRPAKRGRELDGLLLDELAVAVVQRVIEREYNTTSSTLAIQDGPLAGQTVPHVHVHVLPRKEGDFARNDDIYDELEKWRGEAGSNALDDDRPPRSAEEMAAEANTLRALFRD